MVHRRNFLLGSFSLGSSFLLPSIVRAEDELRAKAEKKGLLYGCSVMTQSVFPDKKFATQVAAQANILVAEFQSKRKYLQPAPNRYDFSAFDSLINFAQSNSQLMRGHTLMWHNSNPDWLVNALRARTLDKDRLITDYISTVMTHYKGKIHSWDVVNEAVKPEEHGENGMRESSPWFGVFGEEYIKIAFNKAKETDPGTLRFINDYGVECVGDWFEKRRTALLKLLDRMMAADVPIQGFGIQGHLAAYTMTFNQDVFAKFLREIEGYGLKIMITEFDVADNGGAKEPQKRDADVAAMTRDFLDVALESKSMLGVLSWGLSDRYSWLNIYPPYKWPDGQKSRGLPLDENMVKKPMWFAIADALDSAAPR